MESVFKNLNKNNKGAVGIFVGFFVGILLLVFAVFGFLLVSGESDEMLEGASRVGRRVVGEEENGFADDPFYDMTIPYLRGRGYESELTNLRQYSRGSNYTSYIASYPSDNFVVNGLLTIPDGSPPEGGWPAVVFVHGYIPPASYQTTQNYSDYVDSLARSGLVVFKIDLRGHGESEGEAFGAYYSGDYIVDVLSARAALAGDSRINGQRIGLWGHSMAGNVVFRALVASEDVGKAVIWAGAVYTYEDFGEVGIDDNSYVPPPDESPRRRRREQMRELHGSFDSDDEFWKLVPATNFLDGVDGEVQLHHAVNDNVVDIEYSRNLVELLSGTGIDAELYEYSNGGHNLVSPAFSTAMQRSAEFLKDY